MSDQSISAQIVYKDIPGFPGYRAGDDGSVWCCRPAAGRRAGVWGKLKGHPRHTGIKHLYLTLRNHGEKSRRIAIHTLVLWAFVGPCPDGLECLHGNGIPGDNRLSNLRWGTHTENMADARKHGTLRVGEANHMAKITEADVREIRRLRETGLYYYRELAEMFGICEDVAQKIARRKIWKHVQ